LVISDVIQRSGILDVLLKNIFSQKLSYRSFLGRMMVSSALVSAWVNNTPLVAMLMPYVYDWGRKKEIAPSKLLIPLSYATILGGTITLVGTSTNLVVNGFVIDAGLKPLNLFDFSPVGIPLTIFGIAYLYFWGPRILPERKDALTDFGKMSREYLVETLVAPQSVFIGQTVEQAGLRNLRGLFLVEIIRKGLRLVPVSPDEVIQEEDILIFAGDTDTIIDLVKSPKELTIPKYSAMFQQANAQIVEVVLTANSTLIDKNVKEAGFRAKYDAAIVAINRNGERLSGKIGDVELKAGDLLLLITGRDFYSLTEEGKDFYIISKLREIKNLQKSKLFFLIGGTISAFFLSAIGVVTLFKSLLILLCLIALLGISSPREIKRSLDIDLFVILALSIAIGKAISKSGADLIFANWTIEFLSPLGSNAFILLGVYLATNILAMLITNKAATAITFPIAIATASSLGVSYVPFALAVALAGSCEFMTPFGYQTNLMVYGPGGYKFKDYLKIGWGLTLIYMLTCVGILSSIYGLF
jgi:di/tricarboxylate transporter